MNASTNTIAALRRTRREAHLHEYLETLTARVRALSGSGRSLAEARALRDRYARALCGYPASAGGDLFAEWLLSDAAGSIEDEADFDDWFVMLGSVQIDAVMHGAGAVREAMRRR